MSALAMRDDGDVATTRGKETVRDMVLSLAAIGVVVAGIYWFGIPHDDNKDPVKTVDYSVELGTARRAAPYPVAAPEPGSLPRGWRATSVTYRPVGKDGAAWHLGFLNPDNEYAAVEQSDSRAAAFVDSVTQRAKKTGDTQQVGDDRWDRYAGPKYDALVHAEQGVTTVVTGTAPYPQLAELADKLSTTDSG